MASLETTGIIQYVLKTGLPHKVTSIDSGTHAVHSYHFAAGTPAEGLTGRGLAVDFAGTTPNDEVQMAAIYAALMKQSAKFAELIHNGPATPNAVHNGVIVLGAVAYGPVTWAAHQNHVHAAVRKGTFLAPPPPIQTVEVRPMWDPPLQVVDFLPYWNGSGGYMFFADGGIGAVGDAPNREGQQPFGHDYWKNRKPARLERLGENGYTAVATSGERYDYP